MGIFSIVSAKLSAETCTVLPQAKQSILSTLDKSQLSSEISSMRLEYEDDVLVVKGGWTQVCAVHEILQDLMEACQEVKGNMNIEELAMRELSGTNLNLSLKSDQDQLSDNEAECPSCDEISIKQEIVQELDEIAVDINVVDNGCHGQVDGHQACALQASAPQPPGTDAHSGEKKDDNDYENLGELSVSASFLAGTSAAIKCEICNVSLHSVSDYEKHRIRKHLSQCIVQLQEKRPVQLDAPKNYCPECYVVVDNWAELEKHFRARHSEDDLSLGDSLSKVLKCSLCKFTSCKRKSLKYHVMRSHWDKQFECETCHKKFGTQRYLTTHIGYAHKKDSVICKICDKKLKNTHTLKTHIKLKHNNAKEGKKKKQTGHKNKASQSSATITEDVTVNIKKEFNSEEMENPNLEKGSEPGISQESTESTMSKHKEAGVVGNPDSDCQDSKSNTDYLFEPTGKCHHCDVVEPVKTEFERHQLRDHLWQHIAQLQNIRKIREAFQQTCCPECYIVLEDIDALIKHFQEKHVTKDSLPDQSPDGTVHCTLCYFSCSDRRSLKFHVQRKHWEKHYSCYQCGKKFATQRYVNTHFRNTHKKQSVSCELCGKELKNALCLKMHIQTVHEKKERQVASHLCGLCGKVIRNKTEFNDHMNKHNMIKAHKCETCGKAFYQRGSYRTHLKTHEKSTATFICEICGKGFFTGYLLKVHKQAHISKCYECDVCDRSFAQKSALSRHKRIHTGERPYHCQLCDKKFGDYSILRRHVIGVHKQTDKSLMEKAKKYSKNW